MVFSTPSRVPALTISLMIRGLNVSARAIADSDLDHRPVLIADDSPDRLLGRTKDSGECFRKKFRAPTASVRAGIAAGPPPRGSSLTCEAVHARLHRRIPRDAYRSRVLSAQHEPSRAVHHQSTCTRSVVRGVVRAANEKNSIEN